jgi:UDP-3-O-[3-hydroxymyristoyl] glucosamine N-acyltransferase
MQKTIGEIAEIVSGIVEGDETVVITGVAGIKDAGPGDVTFLANPKYLPLLPSTRASAIIVDRNVANCEKNLIRTEHPYLAFTQVLKLFAVQTRPPKGIHPTAIIGKNVFLGDEISVHAGVVLEDGCKIGARSVLYPAVCVGSGVEIGADCIVYPRVVISRNVLVGDKVIIHSGAVIGGQPRPEPMQAEGIGGFLEGTVVIEDDVEIGANVTINRSSAGTTVVGCGTKIDNLVHIGSDAAVGCNCIIISHVTVGSGCTIGDGVTIAGQAGILDGVTVGDGTIIAARAGVEEDVGPNRIVSGLPASNHEKWLRIYASMKRLPTIVRDIRDFKKRLDGVEDLSNEEAKDH